MFILPLGDFEWNVLEQIKNGHACRWVIVKGSVAEWCEEHLSATPTWNIIQNQSLIFYTDQKPPNASTVSFASEADLIVFKLRWL